ncbi:hypothetical protein [Streptomyces sioyaensis]|uniref:hypothetical protein n=1 Tax=Streptomyces sioyaensis TaxID=67364 RepID=UPI00378747A8
MAFRTKNCVIAVCDLCGNSRDHDGGERHDETEAKALRMALGDPAELPDTWYQRPDGRLVCWRRDPAHDEARESDGHYRPGHDAMVVTFEDIDDAPNPPYDLPAGTTSWSNWNGA